MKRTKNFLESVVQERSDNKEDKCVYI